MKWRRQAKWVMAETGEIQALEQSCGRVTNNRGKCFCMICVAPASEVTAPTADASSDGGSTSQSCR